MDKEQAEIYLAKSLNIQKISSRNFQYKFLLLNLFCMIVAVALYRSSAFIVTISIIICLNVFFTIAFAKKQPNFFKITILIIIQLIAFCIALNLIVVGMYKLVQRFILWEFIISIIIQVVVFLISFILVKKHADNFKPGKVIPQTEIIASSVAGLSCALCLVLCRIFTPSLSAVVTPIAILINLLACLIGFGVTAAIYRAFLIKKYNINNK